MVQEGEDSPDFILPDKDNKPLSLKNLKGKWVVLYFYPKDNTPGCTIEAMQFTLMSKEFESEGAVILGVSKDSCESHQSFVRERDLSIILLSDEAAEVHKKYGVWRPKKFMGREFLGTARSTFLINPAGKIVKIWDPVKPEGHAKEVFMELIKRNKEDKE